MQALLYITMYLNAHYRVSNCLCLHNNNCNKVTSLNFDENQAEQATES